MRGTPPRPSAGGRSRRFIPACAGNSRRWSRELKGKPGSSPRVRGTPAWHPLGYNRRRFIPACAGNSAQVSQTDSHWAVHPRVCGELLALAVPAPPSPGSSPRVRGTLEHILHYSSIIRFIPACAGNSSSPCSEPSPNPVHPRVCGELAPSRPATATRGGSSPRVRGTRRRQGGAGRHDRFIPACAGNSVARPS